MGFFLRRHRRSILQLLFPFAFLLLTVLFIQFTPRSSQSIPGNACVLDAQCCTTSGCQEDCTNGLCTLRNVFCVSGEPIQQNGQCSCVDHGQDVGSCIQCPDGDILVEGLCQHLCLPDEDPDATHCIDTQGGCSL